MTQALLALENGSIFRGDSIGVEGMSVGEAVFNTAMTGYQEILTDPSYLKQIVALTYPHIGNVGVNAEDEESDGIKASGLIIRDYSLIASSWRQEHSLADYLKQHNTVAIANIDTRRLTRILRSEGFLNACILTGKTATEEEALTHARSFAGIDGMDLAQKITCKHQYEWTQGSWTLDGGLPGKRHDFDFNVVVYEFGVKRNILRMLVDRGCKLTVVPATTKVEKVLAMNPDGVFLSNGPGDPVPCDYAHHAIKTLLEKNIPMFGICLGHQLLALAAGAQTHKMKFGHHGANHPVQDIDNGEVLITSQNHGFAVDGDTLPTNLRATHRSLFDNSLQGIEYKGKPAFGFQGHPEASPGPHDVAYLFDKFIDLMRSI